MLMNYTEATKYCQRCHQASDYSTITIHHKPYLKDTTQTDKVEGVDLEPAILKYTVPQGRIREPLQC